MRYTRLVRCKERQWEQLAELQTDTISLQRDIPKEQNKSEMTNTATKEFNVRILAEIDERWEVSRDVGADTDKKPLIDNDEWIDIRKCLYREERVREMLVDEECSQHGDDSVPIWEYWGKKDTLEQWKWLGELGLFPGNDRCVEAMRSRESLKWKK